MYIDGATLVFDNLHQWLKHSAIGADGHAAVLAVVLEFGAVFLAELTVVSFLLLFFLLAHGLNDLRNGERMIGFWEYVLDV